MQTKLSLLLVFLLSLAVACGGDDGDDDGTGPGGDDADASTDTPDGGGEPDAGPSGATALGQECVPSPDDCPEGHVCLPLEGATHPYCSVECEAQSSGNDLGCEGYGGPGAARCIQGIDTDGDGQANFMACAIVCDDQTDQVCQDGDDCNGTCPHDLVCTDTGQNFSTCQ